MTLQELEHDASRRPEALSDLSANLVFGEGDPDARLMIIGEAPGEDEDLSGRPFVGRAGQLLDRVLASVELERDALYITNIVKFRPPGNRNPRPEEITASVPLLLAQIRTIRPQVIATLGNVPTQFFLGTKEGITRTHGKWFEWHGIRVFPLYHPAYLLRNPSRERGAPKWQTWQDMQELVRVLESLPAKAATAAPIDTAEQEGLF